MKLRSWCNSCISSCISQQLEKNLSSEIKTFLSWDSIAVFTYFVELVSECKVSILLSLRIQMFTVDQCCIYSCSFSFASSSWIVAVGIFRWLFFVFDDWIAISFTWRWIRTRFRIRITGHLGKRTAKLSQFNTEASADPQKHEQRTNRNRMSNVASVLPCVHSFLHRHGSTITAECSTSVEWNE